MTQPSPLEIQNAISTAIYKHDKEVRNSECRYNESLRRQFPAGAISFINDVISDVCKAHRLEAIKEAGEKY